MRNLLIYANMGNFEMDSSDAKSFETEKTCEKRPFTSFYSRLRNKFFNKENCRDLFELLLLNPNKWMLKSQLAKEMGVQQGSTLAAGLAEAIAEIDRSLMGTLKVRTCKNGTEYRLDIVRLIEYLLFTGMMDIQEDEDIGQITQDGKITARDLDNDNYNLTKKAEGLPEDPQLVDMLAIMVYGSFDGKGLTRSEIRQELGISARDLTILLKKLEEFCNRQIDSISKMGPEGIEKQAYRINWGWIESHEKMVDWFVQGVRMRMKKLQLNKNKGI